MCLKIEEYQRIVLEACQRYYVRGVSDVLCQRYHEKYFNTIRKKIPQKTVDFFSSPSLLVLGQDEIALLKHSRAVTNRVDEHCHLETNNTKNEKISKGA